MGIQRITFEEYFEGFKDFYNLDYLYKEIDLWITMQSLHGNFFELIPSINSKRDGPPSQRNFLDDCLLNQITKIDECKEIYQEIDFTLCKLNKHEHYMFNLVFLKKEHVHFFAESDLIVTIAKNNHNYMYFNVIEASYLLLKDTFIRNIKKIIYERKRDFERYIQLYPQLIPSEWEDIWIRGNGLNSRRRYMFVCATLYKEGWISLVHFEDLITPYHGGHKYYRFIANQSNFYE